MSNVQFMKLDEELLEQVGCFGHSSFKGNMFARRKKYVKALIDQHEHLLRKLANCDDVA